MITYIFALVVLVLTLIMHVVGIQGLYFEYSWYDIFMHLLGGVGIGLFITAFVKRNFPTTDFKWVKIVAGVFLVGIIWELFEMFYDIAGAPLWTTTYYVDSVKDLINDSIGGAIVGWICLKKR